MGGKGGSLFFKSNHMKKLFLVVPALILCLPLLSQARDPKTDQVVIKLKDDNELTRSLTRTRNGLSGMERSVPGTYVAKIPAGDDVQEVAAGLNRDPFVAFAEPDYIFTASFVPDDDHFSDQWGLNDASDHDIDAPEAWDIRHDAGGVVVGVIDTGIIGAQGDNGAGVAGVAWSVELAPLKVLDDEGSGYSSDIAEAIHYAREMGFPITNNSYGGYYDPWIEEYAVSLTEECGQLFIAAAGNQGYSYPSYPARYDYDNVIAVGASNSYDNLAYFSNYGSEVDIAAPGQGIKSAWPGNQYAYMSGTSMAAPHVSGTAALVWAEDSGLIYSEVRDMMFGNADSIAALEGKVAGGRRLNLYRALCDARNNPPVVGLEVKGSAQVNERILVDAGATYDIDVDPLNFRWDFGDGRQESTSQPYTYHEYARSGEYVVSVTVSDGKDESVETASVSVFPAPDPTDSVTIRKAVYNRSYHRLRVWAESSAGQEAALEAGGYGAMEFKAKKGFHVFNKRKIKPKKAPKKITVRSSLGSEERFEVRKVKGKWFKKYKKFMKKGKYKKAKRIKKKLKKKRGY